MLPTMQVPQVAVLASISVLGVLFLVGSIFCAVQGGRDEAITLMLAFILTECTMVMLKICCKMYEKWKDSQSVALTDCPMTDSEEAPGCSFTHSYRYSSHDFFYHSEPGMPNYGTMKFEFNIPRKSPDPHSEKSGSYADVFRKSPDVHSEKSGSYTNVPRKSPDPHSEKSGSYYDVHSSGSVHLPSWQSVVLNQSGTSLASGYHTPLIPDAKESQHHYISLPS